MRYPDKEGVCCLCPEGGGKAYIRFLHALPNDPAVNVDLYVNKKLVAENFKYQDFTYYYTAKPGSYIIQVNPTGNKTEKLLETKITLSDKEIATVGIIGTVNKIETELVSDGPHTIDESLSKMRFINFSPTNEAVNIYIDEKPVIYDLKYTEVTEYIDFVPGKHTLTVELANTNKPIVYNPEMELKGGYLYATYVVGLPKGRPLMEVLIPLEGATYLKFE